MNHQTAKIIAESYRGQAKTILFGLEDENPMKGDDSLGFRTRSALLHDHAAVWERVAERLKTGDRGSALDREPPHVP